MNRQQFNKYLSGQIYPSRHNLQRICEFFALTEQDLNLEETGFDRIIINNQGLTNSSDTLTKALNSIPNAIDSMSRYQGYYYSHFHALGFPGSIVRSLIHIYRHENHFITRDIEHLWNKEKGQPRHHRFKYRGVAFYLADRIFITEHEILNGNAICQTILIPSYRNVIDSLSGISTGVGSLNTHMPKSTRIEYKYLGKQINLRNALAGCGLFDLESKAISADIKARINNEILPQEHMLIARDG